MQEMHEQKMHYLHDFHRQALRDKEAHLRAVERERERAERLAGVWDGRVRVVTEGGGDGGGGVGEAERVKEAEVWRLMGVVKGEGEDGGAVGREG